MVSGGGHISIGAAGPVACAAIASDDDIMYAALQRQKDESLVDLLHRLDAALLQAIDNGELTDEING